MSTQTENMPLLVDTNIWLNYFNEARSGSSDAVKLILFAESHQIPMVVTVTSLKDFYYLQINMLKHGLREKNGGHLTESQAAAAEEYAWACVQNITELATVASSGLVDVEMSRSLRNIHKDFEDDLQIAAAMRCGVRYLISDDKHLRQKSPIPAMSSRDALAMLQI